MIQTTISADLAATMVPGNTRYYWSANQVAYPGLSENTQDLAVVNYWVDALGRVWQDSPLIIDNTYRGERYAQQQVRVI